MDGTWFAEFAPIYQAFTARGISKREADEYELWEVAAAFGGHQPERPAEDDEASDPAYAGFDWRAENERARAEGRAPLLPKPKAGAAASPRRVG